MSTETETQETVAKVGFGVFMAAILGPVGIVIAALAVGIERSWSGRASRSGRSGGWRAHVAAQEDYLTADREYRARRSAAHRAWWRNGADPKKRPAPETGRFGKWARRAWAAVAVGADRVTGASRRFAEGARDGGTAAAEARRNGGTFRDIAGARPDKPGSLPEPGPAAATGVRTFTLAELATPAAVPGPAAASPSAAVPAPAAPPATTPTTAASGPTAAPEPVPAEQAADIQPAPTTTAPQQEEPMTAPTTAAPAAPAAETNVDLTVADLGSMHASLARITDGVDTLQAEKAQLDAAISAASERVAATGGTAATIAALDSARAVSAELGAQLGALSGSAVEAGDVASAAEAGLRPAQDAQDALHGAGARGEFVSAATN